MGRRRVLDSTALYDAVTTMDTISLLRAGIRGVLAAAGPRESHLRPLLRRDDHEAGGRPTCDWEDAAARAALVDSIARDASALLAALEDEALPPTLAEAMALLATFLGQDLETDGGEAPLTVHGDAAYGSGELLATLEADGAIIRIKGPAAGRPRRSLQQG